MADVVLGHDSLEAYRSDTSYFGAIVGRYANRIAGARFAIDGKSYQLSANAGPNHLHGGRTGFDRVLWEATPFSAADSAACAPVTSPTAKRAIPAP